MPKENIFLVVIKWAWQNKIVRKVIILLLILLSLWIVFLLIRQPLLAWMKSNPTLWAVYSHLQYQILHKTYLGLFYAGILSMMIFVTMPIEMVTLFYLTGSYNPYLSILCALGGIIIGVTITYFIGRIFGKGLVQYFLKEKYETLEAKIEKYGGWILFGLSLIVAPLDLFILVYGCTRYPFMRMIKIVALGQTIKFIAIAFLIKYLSNLSFFKLFL
jgi:membrane protein YqaA with SNARE-associated domain